MADTATPIRSPEIEASFIQGRLIAAYIHLCEARGETAARSEKVGEGLVVDFAADGRPMGIELPSPRLVTLDAVNGVLRGLGLPCMTDEEFAPLRAA